MVLLGAGSLRGQEPAPVVSSQPATFTFSGKIYEKGGDHQPVLSGSLYLEAAANTQTAAVPAAGGIPSLTLDADVNGSYKAAVPGGTYHLVVAGEGYLKLDFPLLVFAKDIQRDFFLEKAGFALPEVLVSAEKSPKTEVSHEVLSQPELTSVPGTMGGDVLRAIQSLPGIMNTGVENGQLLVRGSGPNDNLYLVDRVPIAFPYHFGVISVLDSNLVKDIDFSAGGFGPEHPGVNGGLVDVEQREGRQDHWGFRTDVNAFLAEGEAEGPLGPKASMALAGRYSYLNLFGKNFDKQDSSLPTFADYQAKISFDSSSEVHWDLVALGSGDSIDESIPATQTAQDPIYAGDFAFSQGFNSQGVNFRDTASDGNSFLDTLYHYNFYFNENLGSTLFNNTTIEDFGDWFTFRHDFDPDTQLEAGAQYDHLIHGINALLVSFPTGSQNPGFTLSGAGQVSANGTTPSDIAGAYVDQKVKWFGKSLQLSLGARADYFSNGSQLVFGPRVSAAYLLSPDTTLKGSWGYYYESPVQVRDGFYLNPGLGNPGLGPIESISAILGVEQKLGEGVLFRVEGFDKELSGLISSANAGAANYNNGGSGYSRGVEVFLKRDPTERFFGWISYTFSDSQRQDGPGLPAYLYDFDEPNVFTAVASYKLNPGWDLGIKWTYATGTPYTPLGPGGTAVYNSGGQPVTYVVPAAAAYNSARLPDYNRLDVSTSFRTVYDSWEWRIYLDMFDFLGNQNVLGYDYNADYTQASAHYDLPFLPFLGFEAKF